MSAPVPTSTLAIRRVTFSVRSQVKAGLRPTITLQGTSSMETQTCLC